MLLTDPTPNGPRRGRPRAGGLSARLGRADPETSSTELIVLDTATAGAAVLERRAADFGVVTTREGSLLACQGAHVRSFVRDLGRTLPPEVRDAVEVVFPATGEQPGAPWSLSEFVFTSAWDLDAVLRPGSDALVVAFQPVVELATGRAVGYEGLIRGRLGARILPPDRLFSLARTEDRIGELDRAATIATLRTAAPWLDAAMLFLNVSPSELDIARVDNIVRSAALLDIPTGQLVLEVVETQRTTAFGTLRAAVRRARELGMQVALDGVGAGYASLELLCRLEPDTLKISMGLTHQLPHSATTIAGLCLAARHMGAVTVLEGVETAAQERHARTLGIELVQGFRYGRPTVADAEEGTPS